MPHDDHPSTVLAGDGEQIEVDEEVARLLAALWNRGVTTLSSCQDTGWGRADRGFVRVTFATPRDANKFLILARRTDVLERYSPFVAAAGEVADRIREVHVVVDSLAGEPTTRPWHVHLTRGSGTFITDLLFPRELREQIIATVAAT